MFKKIILLFLLPTLIYADAVIFSGNDVKALKQNLDLFGVVKVLSGSLDPSTGGGVVAPIGSAYLSTAHGLFIKTGAGNTAWTKNALLPVDLATQVSGILATANGGTGSSNLGTGIVKASSGTLSTGTVDLTSNVNGVLPVANGGTNLSTTPTNGQLLIGNGTNYTLSGLTGTANQVSVTNGAGSITLSTPQDIATTSNVQFANLSATGTTTLNSGLTGPLKASSGVVSSSAINLASEVTGTLPIANGGTGSATQNFVDLTTNQAVAGEKTFSNTLKSDSIQTTGSSGVVIKNSSGTTVADFGPANTTNSSFSGGLNVAGAFAANGGATLGDASGDSLTINSNAASIPNNLNFDSNTLFVDSSNNSVAIGAASVTTSAALDVVSTSKAFLPPRMTEAQRDAIPSPTAGMVVYNTTDNTLDFYNGSIWIGQLASSDYDWTAFTPTTANLGTITSGNTCKHKRAAERLYVECFFTTGTTAAGLGSITLPNSLQIDSAKLGVNNTTAASGQRVGLSIQNGNAGSFVAVVTATGTATDKVYFAANISGTAALVPANGNVTHYNSQPTSIAFDVPISGWTNTGGLSDVVSTPGISRVELFSFSYGTTNATTVCSASPCSYLDQIGSAVTSVTRSGAGSYTINLGKTYTKLKCSILPAVGGAVSATVNESATVSSASTLSFVTISGGAAADTRGTVICHGY